MMLEAAAPPMANALSLAARHEWAIRVEDGRPGAAVGAGRQLAAGAGKVMRIEVDPASRAPLIFVSVRSAVVFDGRLHNRPELQEGVGASGTEDDAELVLRVYERFGRETPRRLRGEFALCIFDGLEGQLLAARDRVGIFPLFYNYERSGIWLSTSARAVSEAARNGGGLDRTSVAAYAAGKNLGVEQTLYGGVRRLPPGHLLSLRRGSVQVERYWLLPPVGEGAEWVRDDELGQFPHLLRSAIGRAFDQGQPAIYLSGGLDSIAVAAAAADYSVANRLARPRALSLRLPGEMNEEEIQRSTSSQLGLETTWLDVEGPKGGADLLSAALDLSAQCGAPLYDIWSPAYERLACEAKAQGCGVTVTGAGGDEWLTVSPLLAADMIRTLDFVGLTHLLAALGRSNRVPAPLLWRAVVWECGVKLLLAKRFATFADGLAPRVRERKRRRAADRSLRGMPDWLLPAADLRVELTERLTAISDARRSRESSGGAGSFYYSELRETFENPTWCAELEQKFESGRRLGIPNVDIFWDADLIEFLYRVPPKTLNRGGRSKALIRDQLARRFPGLGLDRQRKLHWSGFFDAMLASGLPQALRELGGVDALAQMGIVEPRRFEDHVEAISYGRDEKELLRAWRILSLESWLRPRI